jgi:hypothetical protein
MDGDVDYSRYSRAELEEALSSIDRSRFPRNYEHLRRELDSRAPEPQPQPIRPLRAFFALLALSGVFYVIDCLVVLTDKDRPDVPWYESGIHAGGPFGFVVTAAIFVFAIGVLHFAKNR